MQNALHSFFPFFPSFEVIRAKQFIAMCVEHLFGSATTICTYAFYISVCPRIDEAHNVCARALFISYLYAAVRQAN